MKVLSLFDGIACGRIALGRAEIPVEIYYASEIDECAIKVAQNNYPDIIQLGDVRDIDFTRFTGQIDLIIGGSPCVDMSIVKTNRQGLDGSQSKLFWQYVKALKIIKPKYFLLENVASMSNACRDTITTTLQDIYPNTECIMIDSALVSAQRRQRYYWTNWHVEQPKDKNITLQSILDPDISTESAVGCCMRGRKTDENGVRKDYGNMPYEQRVEIVKTVGKARCLTTVAKDSMVCDKTGKTELKHPFVVQNGKTTSNLGRTYSLPLSDGKYGIRNFTPVESERLQTLPDNYSDGIPPYKRAKLCGNGWTVEVISHILKQMFD